MSTFALAFGTATKNREQKIIEAFFPNPLLAPSDDLVAESLKDTIARVIPYFESEIKPKIIAGESIIIAAHGNTLRALAMYLEHISEKDILELNIPTGVPLVYHLNEDLSVANTEYLK